MTDFTPPPSGNFYLHHDQRNTLSAAMEGDLPWRSGGDDQSPLRISEWEWPEPFAEPQHVGFVAGKDFGEHFTARFVATNITNQRYMLDTRNTFGGSHYADPRMMAAQIR